MKNYRAFQTEVMAHPVEGPKHADVMVDVCRNIISMDRMIRLTGNDAENIDGVIDAQLDRLIVASRGDERLALFATVAALGKALSLLHGGP